jgi:DNA-binding XRE family transcriptional regulator
MEDIVKRAFSNRLKELRIGKKVNQAQLAEDLQIGRASISNYEIGSRLPDADVIVALADYFDVSTDYLLGQSDNKNLENDPITRRIGLSENTINELENILNGNDSLSEYRDFYLLTLNRFLGDKDFAVFMHWMMVATNPYTQRHMFEAYKAGIEKSEITNESYVRNSLHKEFAVPITDEMVYSSHLLSVLQRWFLTIVDRMTLLNYKQGGVSDGNSN